LITVDVNKLSGIMGIAYGGDVFVNKIKIETKIILNSLTETKLTL
jgi:hypothetical protein